MQQGYEDSNVQLDFKQVAKVYAHVDIDCEELPEYKTTDAAGFDLRANETVEFMPGETKVVGTGVRVALPINTYLQISLRSGLGAQGRFIIPNGVGIIDADYRGEIKAILTNISKIKQVINAGDRIMQGILIPYYTALFNKTKDLPKTTRGAGGLGSTGMK